MADVYRVGVAISLVNNVSAALKVIQKDVLGLGAAVDLTQGRFDRLKLAVGGAAAAFAGIGLLTAFKGLADAGGEVLNAQARMLQIGISQRDVALETAVAYQNIAIAGTTVASNINDLTKLRSVLGTLSAANAALPGYEKAKFDMTGAGIDPSQLPYLVKALDIMGSFNTNGQIDPAKFGPALQEAISAVLTTGGLLTGQGLYQAVRLSGPAASAMGEKSYLQNMVEILLAIGNRGARGLEYGATTFIGGQMSKNSRDKLDQLKLTTPADYTHEGGRYSLESDKIAGYQMLNAGNIIGWIQQYFIPAAKAYGMSMLQAAASLPQTLQLLISTVAQMTPQMARSVQQQAQAAAADPYAAAQKAMGGAVDNFQKSLTGLWQALGTPAAGIGVTILNSLSAGIRNFTAWVGAHPAYADAMVRALLGLGVALTALGAAATIGAIATLVGSGGTIALVGAGIVALGGALYELPGAIREVSAAWKPVSGWFSGLVAAFGSMTQPSQGLAGWISAMARAITGMDHPFQTLGNDFHLAVGWIGGLATALGSLAHPIQAVESLIASVLGASATPPPVDIHRHSGLSVPSAPLVASPLRAPMAPAAPSTIHGTSGRRVPRQSAMADIPADNAVIAAWIRAGAPTNATITNPVEAVTVKNTGDIARGANAHAARQLQRPNTGASGVNLRLTPSGSAALAMPGYG